MPTSAPELFLGPDRESRETGILLFYVAFTFLLLYGCIVKREREPENREAVHETAHTVFEYIKAESERSKCSFPLTSPKG